MKLNPERIIVNSHSALGDTIEYQPFFLMLRTMFPQAEIHCVCNQNTMFLAKLIPGRCDRYSLLWEECREQNELNKDEFKRRFVDCVQNGFSNGKPADLIILMDRRTELIKLALSTDCPHVVTFSYFPALYTPRLHFLPWIPRKKIHEIFHYQHLLKCINPQRYQECFAQLDLEQARPHFNDQENAAIYHQVCSDLIALDYDFNNYAVGGGIIIINPLSGNSDRFGYNYKHEDYVRLGHELAQAFPQLFFVISYFGDQPFAYLPITAPNLKLWQNKGNLTHLLALISLCDLIIVPSTGPAHAADLMGKDVCEMMPDYDCPRWVANGMGQLASRQPKPSVGINQCRYQILREDWKATDESYEQHYQAFAQMCRDFIEQRTLKLIAARQQ